MRIVLDSNILVRAFSSPHGLAYVLLHETLKPKHVLILSNELLSEVTRALRYPHIQAIHGRGEDELYRFASSLMSGAEFAVLNPLVSPPIRDRKDTHVLQTAAAGDAEVLCTIDRDFFAPPASVFLANSGILAMSDVDLMRLLRL